MKFSELLNKDAKELLQMCRDLKKEHMNLRFLSKTTQDVKTSAIRACKKNIAVRNAKGNQKPVKGVFMLFFFWKFAILFCRGYRKLNEFNVLLAAKVCQIRDFKSF